MGRYILTGILYKIQFHDPENLNEEAFKKRFNPGLFDYSSFGDGFIQLNPNISGHVIAKLRSLIIDSLGVSYEKKDEDSFYNQLVDSSLEELISIALSHDNYTFLEYSREWIIKLDGTAEMVKYHYFRIYETEMKFYPENQADHEVLRKMDHLISLCASKEIKPYTELINSIITL